MNTDVAYDHQHQITNNNESVCIIFDEAPCSHYAEAVIARNIYMLH